MLAYDASDKIIVLKLSVAADRGSGLRMRGVAGAAMRFCPEMMDFAEGTSRNSLTLQYY